MAHCGSNGSSRLQRESLRATHLVRDAAVAPLPVHRVALVDADDFGLEAVVVDVGLDRLAQVDLDGEGRAAHPRAARTQGTTVRQGQRQQLQPHMKSLPQIFTLAETSAVTRKLQI